MNREHFGFPSHVSLTRPARAPDADVFRCYIFGQLPYEVTTRDSATTLSDFQSNGNVAILRDLVGADLVQLVSDFDNSCGRG